MNEAEKPTDAAGIAGRLDGLVGRDEAAISEIVLHLQSWLDWNEQECVRARFPVSDSTHIMSPPVWPTRGQIKAWISVLKPNA